MTIKIYPILLYAFSLMFVSCKSSEYNEQKRVEKFVGIWNQVLDSTVIMEFTNEGYYYDSRYNKKSDDFKATIGRLDGTITEEDYGRLLYKIISSDEKLLVVSIFGENNNVEFRRKGYIFEEGNKTFIEIVYKMGKGIEEHIQYAVRYSKSGHRHIEPSKPKDSLVLILPNNFEKEFIYLAFNQSYKDTDVLNIKEDRKIYISDNGVNRISLKEDMNVLLDGFVSSFSIDEEGDLNPVFTLQANEWKQLLEQSKNSGIQKTEYPIHLDSVIVFSSCRFNPSRKFVNQTFKQEIIGNVLDFRYSTIRKELGYLGIE